MAQLLGSQFPYHFQCNRIELQHTAVIPQCIFDADWRRWVGGPVAAPAAVIKDHQVAFARQTLGNHVEMMLSDNPSQLLKLRRCVKIRSDPPYNLSGFLIQDCQDIGFPAVKDYVVRLKTHISLVIPFIGSQIAHAVHMQVIAHTSVRCAQVGVAEQHVLGGLVKSQFVKMLADGPFP